VEEGISREVTGMVSRGITRRGGDCRIGIVDCARNKYIRIKRADQLSSQ
jgi:hypothetical protein